MLQLSIYCSKLSWIDFTEIYIYIYAYISDFLKTECVYMLYFILERNIAIEVAELLGKYKKINLSSYMLACREIMFLSIFEPVQKSKYKLYKLQIYMYTYFVFILLWKVCPKLMKISVNLKEIVLFYGRNSICNCFTILGMWRLGKHCRWKSGKDMKNYSKSFKISKP